MNPNFQEIILKKDELNTLKKLKKHSLKFENTTGINALLSYKLIEPVITDVDYVGNLVTDGTFGISDKGSRYLIYLKSIHKNKSLEWLRYIITTVIAVIALIIAILKS